MLFHSCLLTAVLVVTPPPASSSDGQPKLPELIVPGSEEAAQPAGVIRRFGLPTFRHRGVGPARSSPGEPFFSPDGDTVYVPGNHGLSAFDSVTGRVRFHFRCGGLGLAVRNDSKAGIRIDFLQRPLAGQFVMLEHGTGKELQRGERPMFESRPVSAAFADGKRAIVRRIRRSDPWSGPPETSILFLYDVTQGSILAELGPEDRYPSEVLSADHRRLAFLTEDMELRVFDTETGMLLQTLPLGLRRTYGERCDPTWSSDGKRVYAWRRHGDEMQIVELAVATGAIRVLVRDDRKGIFSSVAVSPDGSYLAYRLNDNPWKQTSYWQILRLPELTEAHLVDIRPTETTAAFSPDSRSFWLLSRCGLARFGLATGKFDPLSADPLSHTEALSFSEDGTRLYGVAGTQVLTWDVATGREIAPRTGFADDYRTQANMKCIYVSSDGRRTIWTGNSHIHSLVAGRKVGEFYAANPRRNTYFDIAADHRHIIHDAYYGELKLGDLWTGKTLGELLPKVRPRQTYLIALAPDNRTMALVHRDYQNSSETEEVEIELWDLHQGRQTGSVRQVGNMHMRMQFSQDSRELRIWHHGTLSRWRVADQTLMHLQAGRGGPPYLIQSTPNRHWFLAYSYRPDGVRKMELVDVHTGDVARSWDYPDGNITAVAFSPDMSLMAVASEGTPAALYRFYEPGPQSAQFRHQTDTQLVQTLQGKEASPAFDAMCELIRRSDACIPSLRAALTCEPISPELIAGLIDQLDSPEFATRNAATRTLSDSESRILPHLEQALAQGGSREKLERLKRILAQHRAGGVSPHELETYRIIEVLTAIRSFASRALLEQLARGDAGPAVAAEAAAALSSWPVEALRNDGGSPE